MFYLRNNENSLFSINMASDQRVDPQAMKYLAIRDEGRMKGVPTPKLIRQWQAELKPKVQTSRDEVAEIKDLKVPGQYGDIPVRVYHASKGKNAPVALYLHGGGFVAGNIDTRDNLCKSLCRRSGQTLISVDYALAPEHKYPAALDDCQRVAEWALAQNPKIALIGDSAGAGLAAVLAWRLQNQKISGQVLINPFVDLSLSLPSIDENEGIVLTRASLLWMVEQYLPEGTNVRDPSVSPLFIGDLKHVCNTFILTAECDPLKDDGTEFAKRLKNAGVRVIQKQYPGMVHGFIDANLVIDRAQEAIDDICMFLSRLPSPSASIT
jgi:acetyl esterase